MTDELISIGSSSHQNHLPPLKKKRNLPGTPDPEAEVISLSPKTLMATNRFLCEICGKGFQRDQNLQLHRRGHNLPWKLKQRTSKEVRKRVYVCPEKSCVHHHPSRALGDLTGIKKHFCRKHGEKRWKCDKCSKRYAVHSDWKAHSKTCGTREYKCDCGTIFSRRDSFITHRAFCDALAEETARYTAASQMNNHHASILNHHFIGSSIGQQHFPQIFRPNSINNDQNIDPIIPTGRGLPLWMAQNPSHHVQDPMSKNVQEFHPMGLIPLSSETLNDFTTTHNIIDHPCSNPPPSTNYHLHWDFANKITPNGPSEVLTNHNPTNNIPLTNNVKEAISVPSLFSTQNQSHQPTNANISATALLQKASQIGNISSAQDGNKLCGLYGSSSGTSGLGSDVESSVNDLSALTQMEMYPSLTKRRRLANDEEIINAGGETRDFLGVGIQSICHPSSINGWI
ncbi:zinc finger protein magpie [Phtheirospermum japonicum]|uniref:Zinc finger protein magpie n=1 Tax=Phtheirospermum japonicum TaxID=374723 RepID=A0A830BN97_9LAMI|nr:zinc finger protein magpie [Phtheirospermum japonicum]